MKLLVLAFVLTLPTYAQHRVLHWMKVPFVKHSPQTDGTISRTATGDLLVKDKRHGDVHIWTIEEQRNYQRYLTEERHGRHMQSALFVEEATSVELTKFLDWLHTHPAPSPFPNRY